MNFNSTNSHHRQYSVVMIIVLVLFVVSIPIVYAEELAIPIPQGDHTRGLKTVVEWYVPINHDIKVGDTITWVNEDITGHTVTSGKGIGFLGNPDTDKAQPDGYFDSGIILPEKSWSFTFKEKGFFEYTCTIHPWVERSITVLEPGVEINDIRISYASITTIVIILMIIGIVVSIVRIRQKRAEKSSEYR